jgi:hypothetical protein
MLKCSVPHEHVMLLHFWLNLYPRITVGIHASLCVYIYIFFCVCPCEVQRDISIIAAECHSIIFFRCFELQMFLLALEK